MNETTKNESPGAARDDVVVLKYPSNQLKEPERDFSQTMSVYQVLTETFFSESEKNRAEVFERLEA